MNIPFRHLFEVAVAAAPRWEGGAWKMGLVLGGCLAIGVAVAALFAYRRSAAQPARLRADERYRHLLEHGAVALCELDLTEVRAAVEEMQRAGVVSVRLHLEEHPQVALATASRARVVNASRACLEMFGVTAGGGLEDVLSRVLVPETPEILPTQLEAVARAGCTVRVQTVARRITGEPLHIVVGTRLPPAEGPWDRVLVTIHDVTRYELAEEKFRLAVEGAPNAMILVDCEGRIVLVNSQAENLFGWPRVELLGQRVEVLIPERYRARHPGMRRSFFAAPSPRAMGGGRELYGLRRDGREVPIEIGLNPLATSEGMFVLSAIIDITERKRSEERIRQYSEELERTNQQLQASNRELENFAHVASHDLQEPLRKITAFSGLLVRDAGDELNDAAQRDLRFITDAADRMRRLVRDLLTLSRTGRSPLQARRVPLTSVLDEALRRLSVSLEESGTVVEQDELPEVLGDRVFLTELFQNLLSNAIKFRREDRPARVRVTAVRNGAETVLGVSDNGIGIAPEYREQVFAPFKRLHGREAYEGTGVGLAICRHAVERHGGRIWVEEADGGGAHFRFTLPGIPGTSDEACGPDARTPSATPLAARATGEAVSR